LSNYLSPAAETQSNNYVIILRDVEKAVKYFQISGTKP
jgi:hypothetical protein